MKLRGDRFSGETTEPDTQGCLEEGKGGVGCGLGASSGRYCFVFVPQGDSRGSCRRPGQKDIIVASHALNWIYFYGDSH